MDIDKPFELHPDYAETLSRIELPNVLEGGTRAIRKGGAKWLPQYEGEDDPDYRVRLALTRLPPVYRRALRFHADRVFEKPYKVKAGATLPAAWEDIENDIDGRGSTLLEFAYRVFKNGEHHGIVHVLADGPPDPGPVDQARGYLRMVTAMQLYNWRREGNKLVEIRIAEKDENGEELARIIRPDEWALFRKKDGEQIAGGPMELGYIPLSTWRAEPVLDDEFDQFTAEPYLEDTAQIALELYRSHSDQRNALHIARRPKYLAKGLGENFASNMGGSMLIEVNFDGETSDVAALTSAAQFAAVVEDTGPITIGYEDLEKLREEAALETGQSLLHDKPGTRTATEKALDTAEASCGVQRLANGCADLLNSALFDLGQFSGVDMPDTIELNRDVAINVHDDIEAVWRLGDLFSVPRPRMRELIVDEYMRRGIISESTDTDAILDEAEEQANEEGRGSEQDVLDRARRIAEEQGDDLDTNAVLEGLRNGSEIDGA